MHKHTDTHICVTTVTGGCLSHSSTPQQSHLLCSSEVPEGLGADTEGLTGTVQHPLLHLGIAWAHNLFVDAQQTSVEVRLPHLLALLWQSVFTE